MAENIQIKINAAVESAQAAQTIGQLKKSLNELQELAEQSDLGSEQFQQLQNQIVQTNSSLAASRDRLGDIQDKISTLEGTPVERLNNSFNLLKQSIFSLDFDKAKIGVEGLVNAFTPLGPDGAPLKGLAAIGPVLKNLGSSVSSLGQTFIQLGKALLSNPLFLLASIIGAIAIGITALLNKLGLLKPIMDAIGAAVEYVTNAFNYLTEAIGLTTAASDDHLAKVSDNTEKELKEIDKVSKAQVSLATTLQGLTSIQVRDIEKVTGLYLQQGESLDTVKRKAAEARKVELESAIAAYEKIKAKNGSLNEDQLEKLDNYKEKYQDTINQIVDIEANRVKRIIDLEKQVELGRIAAIEDAGERAKAQAAFEVKQAQSVLDYRATLIQEETRLALAGEKDKAALVRREINAITQQKQLQEQAAEREKNKKLEEIGKENAAKRKAREEKELADKKKLIQEELKALIEIEDVKVLKTNEGTKERLDAEIKRIQIIEDFETKNAKILEITDTALNKKKEENIKEISNKTTAFYTKQKELEEQRAKLIAETDAIYAEIWASQTDAYQQQILLIDKQRQLEELNYKQILESSKFTEEEKAKAKAEFLKKLKQFSDEEIVIYDRQAKRITEAWDPTQFNTEIESRLKSVAGLGSEEIRILQEGLDKKKMFIDFETQLLKDLNAERYPNPEQALILQQENEKVDREAALRKIALAEQTSEQIKAIKKREEEETLRITQSGFDAVQGLSDAIFAIKMGNLKKGSKEEEKVARQQFNINKALQLGLAVIDGYKAITTSLSQSPVAIGPVPNPAGIASLAFAITTSAANIAKILASKFQPSGGGVGSLSTPSVPSISSSGAAPSGGSAQFTAPTFFGLGGERREVTTGPLQQRVYVVESDITRTQNRVAVLENRAVIG